MLINAQRAEEVRVAIVNEDTLDTYQIAVAEAGLSRGNVYRGVVANVNPALNAAFVDFGAERDGMLPAHDVVPEAYHRAAPAGDAAPASTASSSVAAACWSRSRRTRSEPRAPRSPRT